MNSPAETGTGARNGSADSNADADANADSNADADANADRNEHEDGNADGGHERESAAPPGHEPHHRIAAGALLTAGMAAVLGTAFWNLPREDSPLPAVARYALEVAIPQWHLAEPVNEVVYGTRGFDTFGETFLLLAAVISVVLTTRSREPRKGYFGEDVAARREQAESDPVMPEDAQQREARQAEEDEAGDDGGDSDTDSGSGSGSDSGSGGGSDSSDRERDHADADADADARHQEEGEDGRKQEDGGDKPRHQPRPDTPDAEPVGTRETERAEAMSIVVRGAVRAAVPILAVTGLYLVAWGYSPGGGFPGGAVALGVVLLVYAAFGRRRVAKIVKPSLLETVEMGGAALIILTELLGLFLRGSFSANWVHLAEYGTIRSGGVAQLFSAGELIEVGTGLTIAVFAVLGMGHDWTPDEEGESGGESQSADSAGSGVSSSGSPASASGSSGSGAQSTDSARSDSSPSGSAGRDRTEGASS